MTELMLLKSIGPVKPNLGQFSFSNKPFCMVIIDHFAMYDV